MKALRIILLITAGCVLLFPGCGGDNGSDSDAPFINSFGKDLRTSLPEVKPIVTKLSASDPEYHTYEESQEYGGLFQRVLGDDPVSIFFTVDMMDRLITELINSGDPNMIFGESEILVIPFFDDTIEFPVTFHYNGTYDFTITSIEGQGTLPVSIDYLKGGYSDESIIISCKITAQDFTEGRTIYYAERDAAGKLLIKYAGYYTEFHEGTSPFYSTNRNHVFFLRESSDAPYTYKSARKTIRTNDEDIWGVFSIIMGGVTDEFIIRRRAHFDDGTERLIDQLFATEYNPDTHSLSDDPLEEQSSINPFDVDGSGFAGGGLGNDILLIQPEAEHLNIYAERVAAPGMIDFSEPDDLPSSEDEVTPDGWDF